MFELANVEEYKYFYPDEIENFSTKDIIEKVFFDNPKETEQLLTQLKSID
jgi:hypothetical protein